MRFLPKGLNSFKIQTKFNLDLLLNVIIKNLERFGSWAKKRILFYLKFSITFGHRPDQRPRSWAPPTPHGACWSHPRRLRLPLRPATVSFTGRLAATVERILRWASPSPGAQNESLASPWSSPTCPSRRSPESTAAATTLGKPPPFFNLGRPEMAQMNSGP
jgi:hypothetical protein